ncbi:helix-turn-helix domain-containing protein [Selenomonas sp. F0473]|uniref:helix-turn-helix domain-containing protein n=1 Tax=Selenomonas sp. F0473 TaxID=999423 RepID=UPI0025ECF0B6|nr:helix-turn-helix domain-containing protein [Selenomonas sp. F0473]
MVNVNKLRGKMVECGVKVDNVAGQLGISRATFYRKLESSGSAFTIKEVGIIAKALHLELAELNAIFFSEIVA